MSDDRASRIEKLASATKVALEEAYQAGFDDGAQTMRAMILNAAQVSASTPRPMASAVVQHQAPMPRRRAKRGAVGQFVFDALRQNKEGLSQQAIKELAGEASGFSATSIGNELRRFEGRKYLKDRYNHWYLKLADERSVADAEKASATPEDYQLRAQA